MVEGEQFLIQPAFAEAASRRQVAVSRLGQKKDLSQRPPRLCGKPDFTTFNRSWAAVFLQSAFDRLC